MQILKFWIIGALLAQWLYLINGDKDLKKKINSSSWRKQWKQFSGKVMDESNEIVDKVQHIDYEWQRKHIKDITQEKEKDLQKHIKKLHWYADSLWEKKLKEIVNDIQSSSEEFIKKIQPAAKKAVPTGRQAPTKKTTTKKKTPTPSTRKTTTKKTTTRKSPARKKTTK